MPDPLAQTEPQARWLGEMKRAEDRERRWRNRAKKIVRKYAQQAEDVANERTERQFALLWSNTETIEPAIYARPPQAVVTRRYRDGDPVAREATTLLERGIGYTIDVADLHGRMESARKDLVLVGRGTLWVRYEPTIESVPQQGADGEPVAGEDGEPLLDEKLVDERIHIDFVHWSDFLHGAGRTWPDVPWVSRRTFLAKEELTKRFGSASEMVQLDHRGREAPEKDEDAAAKATVYEIWSKVDNKVFFVAKGAQDVLEEREPLLRLEGFFPCPRPAYGTLTTDRLEPTPDYVFYQDQADEIDRLTKRMRALLDSLKLVGFYPGGPNGEGSAQMARALKPGVENEMIPVPNWAAFAEKGGTGAIMWLPVDMVLKVLQGCVEARRQLIEDVYQLSGISDIMRGSTEASETLGAQQLKSQWGSVRVRSKQGEMARLGRDVCRMIGEILSEAFSPETLLSMTNMKLPSAAEVAQKQQQDHLAAAQQATMARQAPPPPPMPDPSVVTIDAVMGLLKDDRLRGFVVDIETDSTVQPDEDAEKQRRTEFLTAVGGFMKEALPIITAQPAMAPMFGKMLLFGVRGFRVGRELEETIETTVEEMTQRAAQPAAPPPPDPRLEAAKIKAQAEGTRAQADMERTGLEMQAAREDHAMGMRERQADHAIAMTRATAAAAPPPQQVI